MSHAVDTSWHPNQGVADQIVALLAEFLKPGADQAQVVAHLNLAKTEPDFGNYVACIFAYGDGLPLEVRQSAGLLLKNALAAAHSPPPSAYVCRALLPMLVDPRRALRHVAGSCATCFVSRRGLGSWPELVPALAAALAHPPSAEALEGALDALFKISEEQPAQLEARDLEGGEGAGLPAGGSSRGLGVPSASVQNGLDALGSAHAASGSFASPGSCSTPGGGSRSANDVLLPLVLSLFPHPSAEIRALSVGLLNAAAPHLPAALAERADAYLSGLFALALDPEPSVRRGVCAGLVQALVLWPERLRPSLAQLAEYMLACSQDPDEGVAIEACEFWAVFCDAQADEAVLRPCLPRLLPVLLANMVYEEDDAEVVEAEAAEERALGKEEGLMNRAAEIFSDPTASPEQRQAARALREHVAGRAPHQMVPWQLDARGELAHLNQTRAEDGGIEPVALKPRAARRGGGGVAGGRGDEGSDDEGDEVSRWNRRRCSASALDTLSLTFGDALLPAVLPVVERRLSEAEWRSRESALLALGAVSQGCTAGLAPYLSQLVRVMLPSLADPHPMLRLIACWALARYSHWLLAEARRPRDDGGEASAGGAGREGLGPSSLPPSSSEELDAFVEGVCGRVLDRHARVQEAACAALAAYAEEAGFALRREHWTRMLAALSQALQLCGPRGLRAAYDALVALAEHCQGCVRSPEAGASVLPALFDKLRRTHPRDPELPALLECVGSVCAAAGPAAEPWVAAAFGSCLGAAREGYEALAASGGGAATPPALEAEEAAQLLVCALDAVGDMLNGLGSSAEALVRGSPLLLLALHACRAQVPDLTVRQSAFGLLGDLSKTCLPLVRPAAGRLLRAVCDALDACALRAPGTMPLANNAAWAAGELVRGLSSDELAQALRDEDDAAQALPLLERLARIVVAGTGPLPRSLVENAAVALGRLALVAPGQAAPAAAHFLASWCTALRSVRDGEEKEEAFRGLCAVVRGNAEAALGAWTPLCLALASWQTFASDALVQDLRGAAGSLRMELEARGQWADAQAALSEPLARKLQSIGIFG